MFAQAWSRCASVLDLVEARQRVLHVARIGERLLALLREGKSAVRQIVAILFGEVAVLGVRLPG
jgi:hypothetical protein